MEKSNITFSRNTSRVARRLILNKIGFKEIKVLGTYLGVSLIGRSPKIKDYMYLIEKFQNRLSNWKRNQLSFIGRVTLAKAVIEALPTYSMMATAIPKACIKEIQKL